MRFYQETKRLEDVQSAIKETRLHFGPNKLQELIRLVYEVSRRDNIPPRILLKQATKNTKTEDTRQAFVYLRDYFLKKRFSIAYGNSGNFKCYLPKVSLDKKAVVSKENLGNFYPENIFVEQDVKDYSLTKRMLKSFSSARHIVINYIGDYVKSQKNKTPIINYNSRAKNLFLIKERFDFIKPCPCSKGVIGCGYCILNLGFGCIYECSYCFLQGYTNAHGIILPVNIEDFLKRLGWFINKSKVPIRIGTGEFTDSLALDNLTDFSKILIDFFSRSENAKLELKTKSNNVKNILKLRHNKNTVISWSLNPQPIIDSDEWQASSLKQRLDAAKECCQAGYPVGFHFDPIIYSSNWENLYRELVDNLFKKIGFRDIAWISLGTFRFVPRLKTIIEQRFPNTKILNEELMLGFDKKLRYNPGLRTGIYKKMSSWIKSYSGSARVYLCMEPKEIWQDVLGRCKF
ncbi:MAG: hypothetical protein PHS93_01910 [Candidatus Omnitrophica bacterium]|nr:hypothetical protein [Candidatus Omnitrophota bacterium]MDD5351908.1 hypothetical protein [Candidatus Omnitrophota bacterium]MDD5550734.1 hypothetical protein [Candidatus Omnitrophota bacterium]